MIQTPFTITLPGDPAPKGSLRCIGARGEVKHQLIEDERVGQKQWRKAITSIAATARQKADQHQPLGVDVTFTIARGPSHYGTGRNAHRLNSRAPMRPTKQNTNDVDKMLRLLLDALQDSGLLVDDAQVVDVTARKAYPVPTVEALTGPTPPPWADRWLRHLEGLRASPVADAMDRPGARIFIYPLDDLED